MKSRFSRRGLFQTIGGAGALGLTGPGGGARGAMAAPATNGSLNLTVKKVERTWVNVPFRPVPQRNMIRELPHWTIFEICKVTLACGVVGFHFHVALKRSNGFGIAPR